MAFAPGGLLPLSKLYLPSSDSQSSLFPLPRTLQLNFLSPSSSFISAISSLRPAPPPVTPLAVSPCAQPPARAAALPSRRAAAPRTSPSAAHHITLLPYSASSPAACHLLTLPRRRIGSLPRHRSTSSSRLQPSLLLALLLFPCVALPRPTLCQPPTPPLHPPRVPLPLRHRSLGRNLPATDEDEEQISFLTKSKTVLLLFLVKSLFSP